MEAYLEERDKEKKEGPASLNFYSGYAITTSNHAFY